MIFLERKYLPPFPISNHPYCELDVELTLARIICLSYHNEHSLIPESKKKYVDSSSYFDYIADPLGCSGAQFFAAPAWLSMAFDFNKYVYRMGVGSRKLESSSLLNSIG